MDDQIFLFVDVDGYSGYRVPGSRLQSDVCSGFRPRELGWTLLFGDESLTGSIYYIDPGLWGRLSSSDSNVRFQMNNIHGLPMNPGWRTYRDCKFPIYWSSYFAASFKHLLLDIKRTYRCSELPIFHKGGYEHKWLNVDVYDLKTQFYDLNDLGMPKVETCITKLGYQPTAPCCQYHFMDKTPCFHCPALETSIFKEFYLKHCENRSEEEK